MAKDNVMLRLVDIVKVYQAGNNSVKAVDGVSLNFRKNEFVSILGPSGSGKTTLINHILKNAKGKHMAVIVNDLGEINIDAELIQKGGVVSSQDDNLVSLQNGCICCTLKKDLINQLLTINPLERPTLNQIIYHDFFNREGVPKYFPISTRI